MYNYPNRKLKLVGQLLAFAMVSFAYYAYHPLPDGAVQPTKQMIGGALIRFTFDVVRKGRLFIAENLCSFLSICFLFEDVNDKSALALVIKIIQYQN